MSETAHDLLSEAQAARSVRDWRRRIHAGEPWTGVEAEILRVAHGRPELLMLLIVAAEHTGRP